MKTSILVSLFLTLNAFPAVYVFSEEWRDTGSPTYNTDTQLEIKGTVARVLSVKWRHGSGESNGLHLLLKGSDKSFYHIVVGPLWYFRNTITFSEGNSIDIFGSKIIHNNQKYILAKWIRNGDSEIFLRNYDGTPFWSNDGGNIKMHGPGKGGKGPGPGGKGRGGGGSGGMGGMMP
jgi:hypothetical protein